MAIYFAVVSSSFMGEKHRHAKMYLTALFKREAIQIPGKVQWVNVVSLTYFKIGAVMILTACLFKSL